MRQIEKKISELSAWDLNKGCKKYINQSTPANRRLKKIIRRQDRKRINKYFYQSIALQRDSPKSA